MPTARELLEQAEALMQRDRAALMSDGIPTLTDSVPAPDGIASAVDARRVPTALDDIPMLTETVEDFDTPSIPLSQSLDDELAMWRETAKVSLHETASEPLTQAAGGVESAVSVAEISKESVADPVEAVVETPAPITVTELPVIEVAAPRIEDTARWNALAEDIRMQVLQRIDIFTDTGLKDQLNQRLQPIVDRASADLVAAINQHVGQLLRAYVAEAIEREIEKWRASSQ